MKKIFENAVWWSGVVMVGLILGVSLQFVRAWTEPTDAPPGGNVGAPINTGLLGQWKIGVLQLGGLVTELIEVPGRTPVAGDFLKAEVVNGNVAKVAWAAGSGGGVCFTYYCNTVDDTAHMTTTGPQHGSNYNKCTINAGSQGHCPSGFIQKYELGDWGMCYHGLYRDGLNMSSSSFMPPGGACPMIGFYSYREIYGRAYLCCQ